MKVSIELALRTREVYQLFERRINGDRLFIDAILHKFNIVLARHRQKEPDAATSFNQIEKKINGLSQQFLDDIERFEMLLAKKQKAGNTKINYVIQFQPVIIVQNQLALKLIEFVEIYDKLIALLKFLKFAECYESDIDYLNNINRYQKMANQVLSTLMLMPATN